MSGEKIGEQMLEAGNNLQKTCAVYKRRKIQESNWWVQIS
jgi:hypothetical protein